MAKYDGELEDLKKAVASVCPKGAWTSAANRETFRAKSGEIINWFTGTGTLQFQGPKNDKFESDVLNACENVGDVIVPERMAEVSDEKKVFIVHGHDKNARTQLELLLYKLDLKPFVLQDEDGESNTIIEALEKRIYQGSSFGIVLMTPDDYGFSKNDGEENQQPRARQNVILEIPSDCDGIIRLEFNEDVDEIRDELITRMRAAGVLD